MSGIVIFKQRIAIVIGMLLLLNAVPASVRSNIALGDAGRSRQLPYAHLRYTPRAAPTIAKATTTSSATPSSIQRYVLLTGTDAGDCSNSAMACRTIGYAIALSNPGDTINIGAGEYVENPIINKDLILQGTGAPLTIVDGGSLSRVFEVWPGVTAQIIGLTIRNGVVDTGAGIVNSGALIISSSIISGNLAIGSGGGGGEGAGIFNDGTLTITNSQISGNQAIGNVFGGTGAGILNGGTLTIQNSQISGNLASGGSASGSFGGGIHSYAGTLTLIDTTVSDNHAIGDSGSTLGGGIATSSPSVLIATNSTISGNTADGYGGGIFSTNAALANSTITNNTAGLSGGGAEITETIKLKNTILAGNFDLFGAPDCEGVATSQGHNLIGNGSNCLFTSANGDQVGTFDNPIDPQLGPLGNNGGATSTHAPLPGSPAVDKGSPSVPGTGGNACESTDQIGTSRPQGAACDIGAVEVFPAPVIDLLSPNAAKVGDAAFTLTIKGQHFINGPNGSHVQWNGESRTTHFDSDTQLRADISAADVATHGTATVTVINPSPGGGLSNQAIFAINNLIGYPTPTIQSLSPTSAHVGGAGFTLTINGTEFVNGVTVQWNGSSRVPTLVSPEQLQLQISAGDIAATGSINVTVVNPSPGGGASNTLTFVIEKALARLPLLFSVPGVSPGSRPACNDNERVNNTINKIPLLVPFGVECTGSFPPNDTLDLYKIQLDRPQTISIDLSNIPAEADQEIKLWDSQLAKKASAKALCTARQPPYQSSRHIAFTNAGPGFYFIGIFLLHPLKTSKTYSYVLRVSFDNNVQDCK
jgi:IPT/TIG domain